MKRFNVLPAARAERLLVEDLAGELLIYDRERHQAHYLSQTTAFVWQHCDGNRKVTDIARLLEDELNVPTSIELVRSAIAYLDKLHLLQERTVRSRAAGQIS